MLLADFVVDLVLVVVVVVVVLVAEDLERMIFSQKVIMQRGLSRQS